MSTPFLRRSFVNKSDVISFGPLLASALRVNPVIHRDISATIDSNATMRLTVVDRV